MSVVFDLDGAELVDEPFRHARFAEYSGLSRTELDELVAAFPLEEPLRASGRRRCGDKTYAMLTVTVHRAGRWTTATADLAPRLQEFLAGLVESDYRHRLAQLLGVPPGPVGLEVRLAVYPRGGWMSRHTDRPDKLFSQNIYLCPGWSADWGGDLALYGEEHAAEPAGVVLPGAGNSVAFARSTRSWHEVRPVLPAARRPRRTVLIHGHRDAAGADRHQIPRGAR